MRNVEQDTQEMYDLLMMVLSKYLLISKYPVDYGGKTPFYRGEIHLVEFLGNNPGCSIKDISHYCSISMPAASRAIGKLEKKDVVYKVKLSPEKRDISIHLTEYGKTLCEGHSRYHVEHKNDHFDFFRSLDEHDRQVVIDFLQCYDKSLKKFV